MGTNQHKPNCQTLAERSSRLAQDINHLIADIESDLDAPAAASLHAMEAYVALVNAILSLEAAAREQTARHYQQMAHEAQQAAA